MYPKHRNPGMDVYPSVPENGIEVRLNGEINDKDWNRVLGDSSLLDHTFYHWLESLRSGKFDQIKGQLKDDYGTVA
jgi:hypothetical protein